MTMPTIGTGRAVEVLHDRGPATPAGGDRWTGGSGYLIGSGLVLTAAHNVDYRRDLGDDEQLLVRTIDGDLLVARVMLVGDEMSGVDLALVKISDPRFGEQLPPVTFARVNRDSPAPVSRCWAVGFPRFGEAGPVLPEGSRRETWHVRGDILPGAKLRAGLLSLQVSVDPSASLIGSAWEGMSGAVVFAADAHDGEQAAVGVISTHHRPEGESALTVVPVTAVAKLAAAARWWRQFGVPGPDTLPVLPRQGAQAGPVRPMSAAGWPLEEVTDPFVLEVHQPVQPEGAPPGLPVLPPYVPRDHDKMLSQVVAAATQGRSAIAVLVGGSSTGKTRACWEALALLRDQDPPWRLWHPIDPSRPDAALRELSGVGPRSVVWLNEAQFYLDTADGLGERVAAGVRELLRDPGRAPVLVLATMWPQFWDTLTGRPAGGEDRHAQARELLAGHDITVPAAFTPAQMTQLARAADVRVVLAARSARDGAVIQFLAGAPELLARYRNAPPAARALIDAAMDALRLGMGAGLAQAFLEAAAPGYLTDAEWDALGEDWLEQALIYTAKDAKGVRGPLTRIRPRPARPAARSRGGQPASMAAAAGPLYRLADYLDQHGRAYRASQIPPAEFWSAAAEHAAPGDQAALGDGAHARGLFRDAAQLHKNAAASGNPRAARYLGKPLATLQFDLMTWPPIPRFSYLHKDPRPGYWAAAHVTLDDQRVVADLLDRLREAGADAQFAALAGRAAAHAPLDDPAGPAFLLYSLQRAGADAQFAELAGRAAAHAPLDDPSGLAFLLDSLRKAGAHEQAAALLARDPAGQAALDDPYGLARLLDELRQAGAQEQAAALAGRAAAHASLAKPWHLPQLLDSLRKAGAHEQAAALAVRIAADAPLDDRDAVAGLLGSLQRAGAHAQFAALAGRAAAQAPVNDPLAVAFLLSYLRKSGAREQAAALLACDPAAHASLDEPYAAASLLDELQEAAADEQAAALAARAAAHAPLDNPHGVARLLDSLQKMGAAGWFDALLDRLREAGAHEQAAAMLAGEPVVFDNPDAAAAMLDGLWEAGPSAQAAALLARDPAGHVAVDDPYGLAQLLDSLRKAGAHEQAAALLARDPAAHATPDDVKGLAFLLIRLREAGAHEQATALAGRAAARAHLDFDSSDKPHPASWLLEEMLRAGAHEQAATLISRLPAAGLFEVFLEQKDLADQFRFGREADGTPAARWDWEDLDLWLVLATGTGHTAAGCPSVQLYQADAAGPGDDRLDQSPGLRGRLR
jgi:uncharacterized protein YidB (DUF937 family)